MEIIVGKTSGFCHGVKNAVEKATEAVDSSNKTIYCLGELVHNSQVTNKLKQKGIQFIESIEEAKGKTIIRAHGIKREIYEKAKQMNIELQDLTCVKVLKIHELVEKYSKEGYYIFLVGGKNHPETIGTYSFCGENAGVIESLEDLYQEVTRFEETGSKKALLITQTTYNFKKFKQIQKGLEKLLEEKAELEVVNTICLSTEIRQKETEDLSQKVDLMLIIGGKNSSNTNKLYDIACQNCKNVIFAESEKDINLNSINQFEKIGIMAGASTPQESIDNIVNLIKQEEKV